MSAGYVHKYLLAYRESLYPGARIRTSTVRVSTRSCKHAFFLSLPLLPDTRDCVFRCCCCCCRLTQSPHLDITEQSWASPSWKTSNFHNPICLCQVLCTYRGRARRTLCTYCHVDLRSLREGGGGSKESERPLRRPPRLLHLAPHTLPSILFSLSLHVYMLSKCT